LPATAAEVDLSGEDSVSRMPRLLCSKFSHLYAANCAIAAPHSSRGYALQPSPTVIRACASIFLSKSGSSQGRSPRVPRNRCPCAHSVTAAACHFFAFLPRSLLPLHALVSHRFHFLDELVPRSALQGQRRYPQYAADTGRVLRELAACGHHGEHSWCMNYLLYIC
jgi:hypothetical protein